MTYNIIINNTQHKHEVIAQELSFKSFQFKPLLQKTVETAEIYTIILVAWLQIKCMHNTA